MKKICKSTSKEEVKGMPVYLALCKETIVDSEGNEKLYGKHFLGVYKQLENKKVDVRNFFDSEEAKNVVIESKKMYDAFKQQQKK